VESAPFVIPSTSFCSLSSGSPHPVCITVSPHHSLHLRSYHLSLPRPFTPDSKLISFTHPFLHSHSYSFRTAFMDLNLYWFEGALAFVCFSFFFFNTFLAMCATLSWTHSAFESTLNSSIVSYRSEKRSWCALYLQHWANACTLHVFRSHTWPISAYHNSDNCTLFQGLSGA